MLPLLLNLQTNRTAEAAGCQAPRILSLTHSTEFSLMVSYLNKIIYKLMVIRWPESFIVNNQTALKTFILCFYMVTWHFRNQIIRSCRRENPIIQRIVSKTTFNYCYKCDCLISVLKAKCTGQAKKTMFQTNWFTSQHSLPFLEMLKKEIKNNQLSYF